MIMNEIKLGHAYFNEKQLRDNHLFLWVPIVKRKNSFDCVHMIIGNDKLELTKVTLTRKWFVDAKLYHKSASYMAMVFVDSIKKNLEGFKAL